RARRGAGGRCRARARQRRAARRRADRREGPPRRARRRAHQRQRRLRRRSARRRRRRGGRAASRRRRGHRGHDAPPRAGLRADGRQPGPRHAGEPLGRGPPAGRLDRSLRGVRIGVPRDFACAIVEPEVARAFEAALGELGHAGATVDEVTIPSLDHAGPALGALILGEARSALAPLLAPRWERVSVELRIYLELGKLVTAEQYLAAQRLRTRLYDEMRAALARVDLLATPPTV